MSAYTDAVSARLNGMRGVSTGECPGCERCAEGHAMSPDEHAVAWRNGKIDSTRNEFSWRPCGICGTTFGGAREPWHWVSRVDETDAPGYIEHRDDACTDCVYYLANGDEPETWSRQ